MNEYWPFHRFQAIVCLSLAISSFSKLSTGFICNLNKAHQDPASHQARFCNGFLFKKSHHLSLMISYLRRLCFSSFAVYRLATPFLAASFGLSLVICFRHVWQSRTRKWDNLWPELLPQDSSDCRKIFSIALATHLLLINHCLILFIWSFRLFRITPVIISEESLQACLLTLINVMA